jgi:HEAT repeat protein
LEKLHQSLLEALPKHPQFLFAESEKALLVNGTPLHHRDQEKPHVASFLGIMLALGLKSISFDQGLEKDELSQFIQLVSLKPETMAGQGGLPNLFVEHRITHVVLDQKVYVAMDKDHKILSSLDITDDQLSQFFKLTHPDMDIHSPEFQTLARNPKALSEAFETGLSKMIEQKETLSSVQLSDRLGTMLALLDKMTDHFPREDRQALSKRISRSLATGIPETARQLTTSNLEHLFGGLLIQYLMTELEGPSTGSGQGFGPGGAAEGEAADAKSRLVQVAEKFSLRLGDERTLMDEGLMEVLPKIIEQLIIQKEKRTLEEMLQKLVENLKSDTSDVRASAARGLADIIDHLPADQKNEILNRIASPLLAWIKTETVMSADYARVCGILKEIAQNEMIGRRFPEALVYLEPLSAVAENLTSQPEDIRKTAADVIEQMATPENIALLKDEIPPEEHKDKSPPGRLFCALGQSAIHQVLDELRNIEDSDERVKTIHLITAAKEKALPAILVRLKKKEPWYYLRNLAYMIGQIGNEDSAKAIAPLLQHENPRLRQEVLKSIQRIGGNLKGKLLAAALPAADETFKISIVDVLGQSKAVDAVMPLLEILKESPLLASAARQTLEERICTALGAIGSPDAIPMLSEIAETKSFLGLRSYPDRVKAAAARSLGVLRRKVAESGPETDGPVH